jgi:hypothetical protein
MTVSMDEVCALDRIRPSACGLPIRPSACGLPIRLSPSTSAPGLSPSVDASPSVGDAPGRALLGGELASDLESWTQFCSMYRFSPQDRLTRVRGDWIVAGIDTIGHPKHPIVVITPRTADRKYMTAEKVANAFAPHTRDFKAQHTVGVAVTHADTIRWFIYGSRYFFHTTERFSRFRTHAHEYMLVSLDGCGRAVCVDIATGRRCRFKAAYVLMSIRQTAHARRAAQASLLV